MVSTRWKKIIRDLISHKARTLLVVLAIAVGVWAFGSVFITQEVLLKNMDQTYRASNPTTMSLSLPEFDETLVRWLIDQPGVADAQGKARYTVKLVMDEDKAKSLVLESVPDFGKMELNLLEPLKGDWPPGEQGLVVERASVASLMGNVGDEVTIELPDGKRKKLVWTGTVYGNSVIPASFTDQLTGYVSWETLGWLGFPKRFNRVEIATDKEISSLEEAEKLADDLRNRLEDRGVEVRGLQVFTPNEHWAEDNSRAFTAILSIIGVFSLF